MKSRREAALLRMAAIALVLTPLAVSSNSPLPLPEDRFNVTGSIVRTGGGPLNNQPVTLLAKRECLDTTWALPYHAAVDLTGDVGQFHLVQGGYSLNRPCSLVVAVVWPDTMLLGTPFKWEGTFVTEWDTRENDGFLCDDTYDVEVAHDYYLADVVVVIP